MKLNPAALLLYLFLPESEALESKASVLLGVFIFKKKKIKIKPSLFVMRNGTPKSFRVLGEKKREKNLD